jgi:Phosphodiester glycosidase
MISVWLRAAVAALAVLATTSGSTSAAEYHSTFEVLPSPGFLLVKSFFFARDGSVVDVETASFRRERVTLRVLDYPDGGRKGEMVLRAMDQGALAAINGGYFTNQYQPDGLLEIAGVVRQPARRGLSGIVGSTIDGDPVVELVDDADTAKLRDAVQSGPFIVDPGGHNGIRRDDGQRAARSVVILSAKFVAVSVTAQCGLYDLANALVNSPATFGLDHVDRALNLDGGPSTGFAVRRRTGDVEIVRESARLRTVLTVVERAPSSAPSTSTQPKAP